MQHARFGKRCETKPTKSIAFGKARDQPHGRLARLTKLGSSRFEALQRDAQMQLHRVASEPTVARTYSRREVLVVVQTL